MSVIERVYGEHNTVVRNNIRKVEERMHRFQTGLAPDPHHVVPYDNHPFDKNRHGRSLQNNSTASSRFQPIRMHFETAALNLMRDRNSRNAAKIDCKYRETYYRKNIWDPERGNWNTHCVLYLL